MTESNEAAPDAEASDAREPEDGSSAEDQRPPNKVPRLTAEMQSLQEAGWRDSSPESDD